MKTASFKKGALLLKEGDVCKYSFKIVKGVVMSYVVDDAGNEQILQFATEDWVLSDMESYLRKTPATLNIKALEDTEVICISLEENEQLVLGNPQIAHDLLYKFSNHIIALHKRLIYLLSKSAVERYDYFTETYPSLMNRIPLKLISSYLGITPEYLSAIRNKKQKINS